MVEVLDELAVAYRAMGQLEDAQHVSEEAQSVGLKVLGKHSVKLGHILYTASLISMDKGDHAKAIRHINAAINVFENAGGKSQFDEAMCTIALASMYHSDGDVRMAEKSYLKALRMIDSEFAGDARRRQFAYGLVLDNVGSFYSSIGDYKQAKNYLLQAVKLTRRQHGEQSIPYANALTEYALLSKKLGRFREAEAHYRKVLQIKEKVLGKDNPNVAYAWHMLGAALGAQGENEEALECDRNGIHLYKAVNRGKTPFMATLLNNVAWSHLRRGDFREGEIQLMRSLSLYRELKENDHSLTGNVLCTSSILKAYAGDIAGAIADLQKSTDIYERLIRLTMHGSSEKAKLNFMQSLEGKTNFAYSLSLQFAPNSKAAARLALTTALQRKGRVMEVLRENRTELGRLPAGDQALAQQLDSVKAKLSSALFSSDGIQGGETPEILGLKKTQDRLERQLLLNLGELGADYCEPTVALVAEQLPPNGVLIEYVKYWNDDVQIPRAARDSIPRRYGVYLLQPDKSIEFASLGEAKLIDTKIMEFRHAIGEQENTKVKKLGQELHELLLAPMRKHLKKDQQILIAPDSMLNLLPFCALINSEGKYLIEDFNLCLLGCGRDLIRLGNATKKSRDSSEMVIISNPACDAAINIEGDLESRRSRQHDGIIFPGLPGAEAEGRAIKILFPSARHLSGPDATEHSIKSLDSPCIVHIASHGFFLPRVYYSMVVTSRVGNTLVTATLSLPEPILNANPWVRSGLALAGADHLSGGHGDDGILTALELSAVNFSGTQLVVLSGCETGVGKVHDGEGVFGLRRALLLSGARSQVLSLWSVDDEATKELMQRFYQNLKNGQDRAHSLQAAQESFLKGKYVNPIYWAAFQMSGDWKPIER